MHRTNRVPQPTFLLMLLGLALGSLAAGAALRAQEQAPPPRVQESAPAISGTIRVPIGSNRPLQMRGKKEIRTVNNPRPDIATVQPVQEDNTTVMIIGRQTGATRITLTAADEKRTEETYEIVVELDVEFLHTLLQRAAPTSNLEIVPAGSAGGAQAALNSIIIRGTVNRAEDINVIMRVAESMVGPGRVINDMRFLGPQQVQLDVVIAFVSRTELRRMSFDFLNDGAQHRLNSSTGGAVVSTGFTQTPGQPLIFTQTFGSPNGVPPNIFLALLASQQQLFSFLQLLRTEQVAKFVGEPRLVVMSGRQAYFLSGGQQAVPSPGGLGAVSVQFIPFGTQLSFIPTVLGNGKIFLEVEPSVSALDAAAGVNISGFTIAGRREQRVHTQVEMEAGQTFVLCGLIQNDQTGTTAKIPVLGDLPFIGTLFSTKSYEERETELVIMVTPHLVDPLDCSQYPAVIPGQETRAPDDFELFLEGILEAPRGQREVCPERRYVPAFKNGPSAAVFPCGDPAPTDPLQRGWRKGRCAASGLADGATMSYPCSVSACKDSRPAPQFEPATHAELLPPVELSEEATTTPAGIPPGSSFTSEGKPATLPALAGSAGNDTNK